MKRPRARLLPLPRLLAAAALLGCCARLGLGSGTGSTPGTAALCAPPGERCRTGAGAGTGQAPTPEATGQLQTEAEVLLSAGTPPEPPGPQGSPGGPRAGREGTGPGVQDGATTEHPGPPLAATTPERAAAGSEWPPPAPASVELGRAAPTQRPAGTSSVGNGMAEAATTPPGTPSHSPSSATVPGSAAGQWGSPSTPPGQSPVGTGAVQRQGGSHSPSTPQPWTREGLGATVPLGDGSPGTRLSIALATDSPAAGTMGTSPFVGELQRVLRPTGTARGLPGQGGGWASDSHPRRGADAAWPGARSAPRPSQPSLEAGGHGASPASPAQPAVGPGTTLVPATGRGSGLPMSSATAGTPGVTVAGLRGALDPTTEVLGPPDTEGLPEHGRVPLEQTWPLPGQPHASVTPGSTTMAQSGGLYASPGPPHLSPSPQPDPSNGSVVPTSPTPQASPKGSRGVLALSPTAGTPPAGLPRASPGGSPAGTPQILGGTTADVGDARPWSATAPPSWQPGSPAPASAPGRPQQPDLTTAVGVTTTAVTATTAAATVDVGMVTLEPSAAVLQKDVVGLTWGPPTHVPAMMPGPPQQPTHPAGTLGYRGDPGSPPAAENTDLVELLSSPRAWPDADTPRATPTTAGRAPQVFIVEDQPPLLRASLLRIPCELVLDMEFVPALRDSGSHKRRGLLHSFNQTVTPLFTSVPGFLWLEVTGIREGSVVLEYDALFVAEQVQVPGLGVLLDAVLGSGSARLGLVVGTAPVLRNVALEWPLDPCAVLFTCRAGFACVAGADGNATCTSLCHRHYCKNQGICTHARDWAPLCQCPVGSDFWFMGLRCDYRVTQQSLLGVAAGVLLSILLLGAGLAAIAVRRFKVLLLEARADQTRSSYRRFCRLDDVSAQYWSRSRLPSASSLDNPAFSNSEELLHLQILDNGCCSPREDSSIANNGAKRRLPPPARPPCQPSFHYDWDTSSSSVNDPMVDSGKASDISVSSWPMEPLPWGPFPLLHQLSRQRPPQGRRPRSYCEGMELNSLERSWTA